MQKIDCPQCNAVMKVPDSGLTMKCEYCGFETEVPDADRRRKRAEKEKEQQRREESIRRKLEAESAARARQEKKEARRRAGRAVLSVPGKIIGLILPFIGLLIPAIIFYHQGLLDSYIGDAGGEYYKAVAREVVTTGQTPATNPEVVGVGGFTGKNEEQFQHLYAGYCYTFVVASGGILSGVTVYDPKGKIVAKDKSRGYSKTVEYCPKQTGLYGYRVELVNLRGRYTYSLFYKPAPTKAGHRK